MPGELDLTHPQATWTGAPEVVAQIRQDCTGFSNCFPSLAAWEQAYGGINFGSCAPGNLVCANVSAAAQIDGSWSAADSALVSISGWVTNATHYIRIFTTPAARHAGVWNATQYRLAPRPTSDVIPALLVDAGYIEIDGLQIENTRVSNYGSPGITTGAVTALLLTNNIIRKSSPTNHYNNYGVTVIPGSTTGRTIQIVNNIVHGYFRGLALQSHANDVITAYNNTVAGIANNVDSYGISAYGSGSSDALHLKNNMVQGSAGTVGVGYEVLNGNWSSINTTSNISHDATSPDVSHRNRIVTFLDAVNRDYHLAASDNAARDAGVNLASDPIFPFGGDIDGESRSGTWDVGADELPSGPPPVDTNPPVRSSGSPSGVLAAGTTQTTLSLVTSETASCRYGTAAGVAYAAMTGPFGGAGTNSHSATVSGLQNGSAYTFYTRCLDAAGNDNVDDYAIAFSIASPPPPDTTAPGVPPNLAATVMSSTQINLSWSAANDNGGGSGLAGYRVFRDGGQIAQVTSGTTYQNSGLTPSTQYSYTVLAYDNVGNASAQSPAVVATTPAPPPPPPPPPAGSALIADHNAVQAFNSIPASVLTNVKNMVLLNIGQSHSMQVTHGMENLELQNSIYDATIRHWGVAPTTPNGTLRLARGFELTNGNTINHVSVDQFWNTAAGMDNVRYTLNFYASQGVRIDAILHTWSWHLNTWTSAQLQNYFTSINQLESEYPNVKFIYMTDVEDTNGAQGYNRHLRNEEIRQFVRNNNKTLFDYGDMDSWNSAGTVQNSYLYNGVRVPFLHPDWDAPPWYLTAHTTEAATTMKAKAMWWLLARLSGWAG
ncbi:MAG: fibronectin type III domain-containing protein [Gemmatimonadota bacterium]